MLHAADGAVDFPLPIGRKRYDCGMLRLPLAVFKGTNR